MEIWEMNVNEVRDKEWIKNKNRLCVCKEEWIHFWCERKERKANTSSNFTQRKTKREQDRLHNNEKEGQDPFSLCEDEEKMVAMKGGKNKEKNGENNQHLWNSEKRSEKQKQWERTEKSITFLFRELQWQIHFPINDKESQRVHLWTSWKGNDSLPDNKTKVIKSKDPVLTFFFFLTSTQKSPWPEGRMDNLVVNSCVCAGWRIRRQKRKSGWAKKFLQKA